MDDREFFCKRHRVEFPTFKKVLEAMPIDRFDYRPHERSPSALELVSGTRGLCRDGRRGSAALGAAPCARS